MTDEPMFSRSAKSNPEKLTERIDVPVSEKMRGDLALLAAAHGVPLSEYARRLFADLLYGKVELMRETIRRSGI
jgi:hypothetical protein